MAWIRTALPLLAGGVLLEWLSTKLGVHRTRLVCDWPCVCSRRRRQGEGTLRAGPRHHMYACPCKDVYIRKVERKDGQLWNVEFDMLKDVKDPGKTKVACTAA